MVDPSLQKLSFDQLLSNRRSGTAFRPFHVAGILSDGLVDAVGEQICSRLEDGRLFITERSSGPNQHQVPIEFESLGKQGTFRISITPANDDSLYVCDPREEIGYVVVSSSDEALDFHKRIALLCDCYPEQNILDSALEICREMNIKFSREWSRAA